MKNFILTCAISILTISMTFGQSWETSDGNLYTDPDSTKVGIGHIPYLSLLSINHESEKEFGLAVEIWVNKDKCKAFSIYDKDNDNVFRVWGSGIVNAKKIYAESFEVRPNAIGIFWYDYVFNNDYKLMSLNEVENFINTNKHLPDIPSENEINESGFNLAEMDGLLLKKIEELTLYVIQQQKEIEELKKAINSTNKTD